MGHRRKSLAPGDFCAGCPALSSLVTDSGEGASVLCFIRGGVRRPGPVFYQFQSFERLHDFFFCLYTTYYYNLLSSFSSNLLF